MADTFLCIHFIFLRDLWHHGCLKSGSDDSPSSGEFEEGKSRDLSVPYLHSPLHFTCPTLPHWPTSDPTVRAQPTVLWTNATTDLYLSSVRSEKAYQLSWRLPTCIMVTKLCYSSFLFTPYTTNTYFFSSALNQDPYLPSQYLYERNLLLWL